MAYQALYRKYRPQRFSELVGQAHVTRALRNAVREDRVGHAYLFSGPRGTGKTSTARILAKALNCTNLGADGEPCGECDSCRSIAAGTFLDLFEIDAASKRKVDDARELREQLANKGFGGRRTVYILDEVHMLTKESANTLLKSLEEPPDHVVFVLATTNPEEVPTTIKSRTQHLQFRLLGVDEITARLAELLRREGIDFDPPALETIALAAGGSARDAESLLDQAIAGADGRLDAAEVAARFGSTPFGQRTAVLEAIAGEDAAGALIALDELLNAGQEARRVAEDLLVAARDAFLLAAGGGRVPIGAPAAEQGQLEALGSRLGTAALGRVVETLGQAIVDMRGVDAADPRLVLEVALVRLSRRDAGPPLQTVVERIERLERLAATGGPAPSAPPAAASPTPPGPTGPGRTIGAVRAARAAASAATEPPPSPDPAPDAGVIPARAGPVATDPVAAEPAAALDLDDVIMAWGELLPGFPPATRSAVQSAQPVRVDGDVVTFGVAPALVEAARPRFKRAADTIRAGFAERLGRSVKFTLVAAPEFSGVGGAEPRAAARTGGGEPEPSPGDEPPDFEEVIDATDAPPTAPEARLAEQLGATVVEELPRQ